MESRNEVWGQLLQEIEEAVNTFGLSSLERSMIGVRNFAAENHFLDVAVLGQFKAGKSSFINGLIGRDLLPVGEVPVTSVITRISYGDAEQVQITFEDGAIRKVGSEQIAEYVTEEGNPGNTKQVAVVDITLPELKSLEGIRLVDTPGIGSVWRHNTETTTGWFPETGAAIFVISAERPISEYELSFLNDVCSFTNRIALVLSKVDAFPTEHVSRVEEFTRKVLLEQLGQDFLFLRYSALRDTDSYNDAIKDQFLYPLLRERNHVFNEVLAHKLKNLAATCTSYLEIALRASSSRDRQREELKAQILDEQSRLSFVRQEMLLIVGSYKNRTREEVRSYLEPCRRQIEEKLLKAFDKAYNDFHGNLYHITRQFEVWLRSSLIKEVEEVLADEEVSYRLLKALKQHLNSYLRTFRERLREKLEAVMGVSLPEEDWELTLSDPPRPDVAVSRVFESNLDLLWFLFPMPLFKKVFANYFRRQIPYEVEKNFYRLVSGLTEKINREMDKMMDRGLSYVAKHLSTIETLLSGTESSTAQIEAKIEAITHLKAELEKPSEQ
jgi:GTPase Era involved in 16S rRNA processing